MHQSQFEFLTIVNSCVMLTLDSMTLYFYSHIVSNNNQEPPPKKRKPNSISTWINNIEPNAPPPSRAASSTTHASSKLSPSLMAGSTHSSNSVLTNAIKVTQNTQVAATNIKKEYTCIEVKDDGTLSDYNETTGQE